MLVVIGLLVLTLGGLTIAMLSGPTDDASAIGPSPSVTAVVSAAPAAEVDRVHDALHDMAALCFPNLDDAAQRRIESDVDLLVTFAGRYPDATFPIDDETGRSLGLLLVARNEMHLCAPNAAARANAALPPQFRNKAGAVTATPALQAPPPGER